MIRTATLLIALVVVTGPALAAPELAELPGPLVLAGGKNIPDDAVQAFFELAGKDKAKIVVIVGPNADTEPEPWKSLNAESMAVLKPDHDQIEKLIAESTGVWIGVEKLEEPVLKYVKKLHANGKVIGGHSLCLACGLLPGFDRTADAGRVGLALEDGAAVVARGRTMRVIGGKPITIHVAKGAGKPAATQEAAAGSLFDLYQLRRAAANRAAKDAFPPAKPKEPVVAKGTLVIVGGGGTTQKIMDTFLTAAGGKDALIVVIPTTEKDGPGDSAYLRKFGATNVKTLYTKNRKLANNPEFSEMLTKAGGVWFGGGRQWNFVDSFEGTLTEKRIHEVLARGGAIGGSSAGASIQSEFMPRGHPLGNTVMAAEGYEKGFGFLPGCAVDQHFFARERRDDMTGLMKLYPQYLGIGIDEATAIVVKGSTAEVMGRSRVAFYDTKKKPHVAYEWDRTGRLVWFDADYEELREGDKYDLKKREKIK